MVKVLSKRPEKILGLKEKILIAIIEGVKGDCNTTFTIEDLSYNQKLCMTG